MEFWICQTFNGLSYAALLFIIAAGFTLVFGVMNIVNMAHGSFYLFGGYIGYEIGRLSGSYYLGMLVAGLAVGILGLVIEPVFLRRFEPKEPGNDLKQMLVTMGIVLVMQDSCLLIWGGDPYMSDAPAYLSKSIQIGTYYFSAFRMFMIVISALIFLFLWWFYEKSGVGAKLRATVDNDLIAASLGINVSIIRLGIFSIACVLCGFGGVIGGSFMGLAPGFDWEILLMAFIIIILGGFGSLKGALIGSVVVGLVDNFGKALFPELSYFTLFVPVAIILAFKPTGLFGRREI